MRKLIIACCVMLAGGVMARDLLTELYARRANAGAQGWADPNTYTALWEMETTNAFNQTLDTSGSGNNATNVGGATWSIVGTNQYGRVEHGYLFDRSDDYLKADSVASLNAKSNFTISVWYYALSAPDSDFTYALFGAGNTSSENDSIRIICSGGSVGTRNDVLAVVDIGGSVDACYTTSGTIFNTANVWCHLVMVFNGAGLTNAERIKLYKDGVLLNLTFVGTAKTTSPTMVEARIGWQPFANRKWNGYLDNAFWIAGNGSQYSMTSNAVYELYQNTHPTNNLRVRP